MQSRLLSPYNDINGKNIWEGDILKVTTTYIRPEAKARIDIVEVKFGEYSDHEGYRDYTHCGWNTNVGTLPDIHGKSEVIGNTKDNPELLINNK